jgi:SAM-dependent methyltransferase
MSRLRKLIVDASRKARLKRSEIFREKFKLDENTKILDLGSENGENINSVLSGTSTGAENVFIADIDEDAIKKGHQKFGFQPVLLDETGVLPFEKDFFDIVYCSSVIEHVTLPKENIWTALSEDDFQREAWVKQKKFAEEIRRVGRQFFVQTPARNFPLESHTWLPFFAFLPRSLQIKTMTATNKFWIKQALPDFNLLDAKQMKQLFPDAEIVFERKFGLIKSIMAIKDLR